MHKLVGIEITDSATIRYRREKVRTILQINFNCLVSQLVCQAVCLSVSQYISQSVNR